MKQDYKEEIIAIKALLDDVLIASYATVNEDGTPHNTPLMLIHDESFKKVYIGSSLESLHVKNMLRTGNAFIVIYSSSIPTKASKGGIYLKGVNAKECRGEDLKEALRVHNATRAKSGREPIDISYYEDEGSLQRMYSLDVVSFEIYSSIRSNKTGLITKEGRVNIPLEQLEERFSC
jgi:hypothetical protein